MGEAESIGICTKLKKTIKTTPATRTAITKRNGGKVTTFSIKTKNT